MKIYFPKQRKLNRKKKITMKKKLKSWIEHLLGIDKAKAELEDLKKKYEESIMLSNMLIATYRNKIDGVEELQKILSKSKVGMDIAFQGHRSWAIICLGKTKEAVHFYEFDRNTIAELDRFLHDFAKATGADRRNMTIDSPFSMRDTGHYFKGL